MAEPTQPRTALWIHRCLLILTCVALLFGLVRLAYPLYRQPQLVAALRKLGYRIEPKPLFSARTRPWLAKQFNNSVFCGASVTCDEHPTTDADLKLISEFFSLMYDRPGQAASCSLDLYSTEQVTDAGISHFRGVQQIRMLQLSGEHLTSKTLEHLQNCRGLVCLRLGHTKITDQGLQYLKNLHNLTYLDLSSEARLNRGDLSCIKGLVKLEELQLWGAQLTDADLANLSGLTSLKHLSLGNSQIAGPGLKHLAPLAGLEYLDLGETLLDDSGMADFPLLPALKYLDLSDTKVTAAGLRHLLKLPGHASLRIARPIKASPDYNQRNITTTGLSISPE